MYKAQLVGRRRAVFGLAIVVALLVATQTRADNGGGPTWTMIGNEPTNTRSNSLEHQISPANVNQLAPKWFTNTATPFAQVNGDVSATPAVADGAVYFGDFGGMLWKLDASDGSVIWSHKVSDYTGITGDLTRSSPVLAGNTLVVGSLVRPVMLGIDATTGDLKWSTQINPDTQVAGHGIITGSPVIAKDTVFVGVSASGASNPATATFRADLAALNAQTGKLLWESFSVPDNGGTPGGYAGATMFAPPAVDIADGLVFGTFGQPYNEPATVKACNAATPGGFSESCEQPGSYFDSIVAFDMKTGAPVWSHRIVGQPPWQSACGSQPAAVTWCAPESDNPLNGGDKWDLGGSGPNVFQIGQGSSKKTVVGVGEKSGVYIVLDAKTGKLVWNTLVGPGGDQGGMEWGTATDGKRIYISITNQHHIRYDLTEDGVLTNTTVTGGSWAALDPETGAILWQTADPQTETAAGFSTPVGVWDLAPVTVANGVLYGGSMAKSGDEYYALDAANGDILWGYPAGASVNAGPAVVGGSVYWGTGYSRAPNKEGSSNTPGRFYAFGLSGR